MNKKVLVAIALIYMFALVGCSSQNTNENATTQGTTTTQSEQPVNVKVDKISRTTEDQWSELADGQELIVLEIAIINNTNNDIEFNPNSISIYANKEMKMISSMRPKDIKTMDTTLIKPNQSFSGVVCFEVDKGASLDKIKYNETMTSPDVEIPFTE